MTGDDTQLSKGRPFGSNSFDADIAQALGTTIRQMRVAAKISQEKLALAAGLERAHIGRIERGQGVPNVTVIIKIGRGLGCDPGILITKTDQRLRSMSQSV